MIVQNENQLKSWISHLVEDISDAEPDALAKYVIALLKKPLSETELAKLCSEKLSVFLQSHTETFVTKLFGTLKTNDYTKQNFQSERNKAKLEAANSEENPEDVTAAEADELVLTDAESEHEQLEKEEAPVEKESAKKTAQSQKTEAGSKPTQTHPSSGGGKYREEKSLSRSAAELGSRASKEDSRKQQHTPAAESRTTRSSSGGGKAAAAPQHGGNQQQASSKPAPFQRKRISPPRASSAERRATAAAERRSSPPMRRRVVLGGGGGGGGGLRVQQHNNNQRHYREARGTRGGVARSKSPRERSRSRSPHIHISRKEKRVVDLIDTRPSLRRHRCRDFHEKGFCMRGDTCPFDHGPDPVVVEDSALEKIVRGGNCSTLFDQQQTSSSYGVNPPPPGVESSTTVLGKPMVVTEGYNPEAPALTTSAAVVTGIDFSVPPPPIPQQMVVQRPSIASSSQPPPQLIYPPGTAPPPAATGLPPAYGTSAGLVQIRPAIPLQESGTTAAIYGSGSGGGGFGGGSHGNVGGGGGFGRGGGPRFKPYTLANRNPASRSLLVKKIPMELNKIAQLDQHFGKFGQVTNIQVQYEGRTDTALVTFKTRRDAMFAYKSTEPIFNNRFIKVFWQNDSQALAELEAANNGTATTTNAPTEGTNGNSTELGPTIPLSTGPMPKGPRGLPRYFTKTFAKQLEFKPKCLSSAAAAEEAKPMKEEENPAPGNEVKSPAATKTPTTNTTPTIQPSGAGSPLLSQMQMRSVYGKVAAAMGKRRLENHPAAATQANNAAVGNKLMELHRMKADLYAKLVDQQRKLLQKLQQQQQQGSAAEEDPAGQKRKLMEMLKKIETQAKKTKAELAELGTKLGEMQKQQQQQTGPKKRPRMSLVLSQHQHQVGGDKSGSQSPAADKTAAAAAADGGDQPQGKPSTPKNKKLFKLCRVVYVANCPPEQAERLIVHMEQFGDLFDYDVNTVPHVFTYKDPVAAQKAVAEAASSFSPAKLTVEWAPMAKSSKREQTIVPDRARKPSEQVTPKDLLASLDYDEEEEEELERELGGNEGGNDESTAEEAGTAED